MTTVESENREEMTTELTLKSPADEVFNHLTREIHHVSRDHHRGDLRFYLQSTDLEKRTVKMRIFGKKVDPSYFQTVKVTIVFPTEDSHGVMWKIVCERLRSDPKDRMKHLFNRTLARYINRIDKHLDQLNHKHNSTESEYPAEECFSAFIKACESDLTLLDSDPDSLSSEKDVLEILSKDDVARTATVNLVRSTHGWMTKFVSLKVTITITPGEGDNNKGSHVEWTTEAEERSGNRRGKKLFLNTAKKIREIIRKKLGSK